ncbi:transposase family protein [Streptomyces sp. PGLac3x]|uniref:transposase family protein n=1 Tax=Streptomyces globisporus TaxID=1908 RepID=UPI000AB716AA|nr:transposase family protein [Streptomyces globisporus]
MTHVIFDGTGIESDHLADVRENGNDLWFSQKHKAFGGKIQFLSAPDGTPLWVSDVEPGSTPDITAVRIHALPALYKAATDGLPTLADKGYLGAGIGILIPVSRPKGKPEQVLHVDTRMFNALLRHVRVLGERTAADKVERPGTGALRHGGRNCGAALRGQVLGPHHPSESIVPPKGYGSSDATRPARVIGAVIGPGTGQWCFFGDKDGFKGHEAGVVHALHDETWSGAAHRDRRANGGPGPKTRSKPMAIS